MAVIAREIGAEGNHQGNGNAQERRPRALGIAEDDGLPEVEKPDAWPPFTVRLATDERERAEGRDEENALDPQGDAVEDAGGQEVEEKSLDGEKDGKGEAAGAGDGDKGGGNEQQCVGILLPLAGCGGGEKDGPGKIESEDVAGEQDHQRAGFRHEDIARADRKTGEREAIAAIGK